MLYINDDFDKIYLSLFSKKGNLMKNLKKFRTVFIIAAALIFITTIPAHAYLDPGTFSYFIQILVAGLVGLSVTIKLYWNNIVAFFKRKKNGEN